MALLELNGITKQFGGLVAVNDFDMDVNEGEIRALIGPNGAGKTTTFNLISGFCPATRGKIIYQGEDITHLKPHRIAKKGLVRTFQTNILFMDVTVLKSLMVARHLHSGLNIGEQIFRVRDNQEKRNERKAREIIEFFGLGDFKDELAWNLPHGHQRTLGIALALATEPKLLMMDEPFTGMTPVETEHMMEIIKRVRDSGVTILLVEHDMKAVMGLSDQITVMDFGKKLAEGPPEEMAHSEMVIEAYLGKDEFFT